VPGYPDTLREVHLFCLVSILANARHIVVIVSDRRENLVVGLRA